MIKELPLTPDFEAAGQSDVSSAPWQTLGKLGALEVSALTALPGDGAVLPDNGVGLQGLQINSTPVETSESLNMHETDQNEGGTCGGTCGDSCPESCSTTWHTTCFTQRKQ